MTRHFTQNRPLSAAFTGFPPTMSLKRSTSSSQPPIDTTNAQPAKKTTKGTNIVLPDDAWWQIVAYVDYRTLPALECAGKTTRDAPVLRDVVDGRFRLAPTTECHYVGFAKKDGYNVYFQDLFASTLHLKWEA